MTSLASYQPVPRSAIDPGDAHWLMQELAAHVERLLGKNWHPLENVEFVEGIPARVKIAWYLWWFACEVAGNGFIGYLGNGSATCNEIENIRKCLREVNDTAMAEALDAGIALSRSFKPDFWNEATAEAKFGALSPGLWQSLEELDGAVMDMAGDPLERRVQAYLLACEAEL